MYTSSRSKAKPCAPTLWLLEEVKSGDWGVGGNGLTTNDVKALQAGKSKG